MTRSFELRRRGDGRRRNGQRVGGEPQGRGNLAAAVAGVQVGLDSSRSARPRAGRPAGTARPPPRKRSWSLKSTSPLPRLRARAHLLQAQPHPPLDGTDGRLEDLRDLRVREAAEVRELDHARLLGPAVRGSRRAPSRPPGGGPPRRRSARVPRSAPPSPRRSRGGGHGPGCAGGCRSRGGGRSRGSRCARCRARGRSAPRRARSRGTPPGSRPPRRPRLPADPVGEREGGAGVALVDELEGVRLAALDELHQVLVGELAQAIGLVFPHPWHAYALDSPAGRRRISAPPAVASAAVLRRRDLEDGARHEPRVIPAAGDQGPSSATKSASGRKPPHLGVVGEASGSPDHVSRRRCTGQSIRRALQTCRRGARASSGRGFEIVPPAPSNMAQAAAAALTPGIGDQVAQNQPPQARPPRHRGEQRAPCVQHPVVAPEEAHHRALLAAPGLPASGGAERHRQRASARRQLEREPPAQRVADQVRALDPLIVKPALEQIQRRREAHPASGAARATVVARRVGANTA